MREIETFLTYLAVQRQVPASTQNQALSAILFLYQGVLDIPIEGVNAIWAKTPVRLPVVLSLLEVNKLLDAISSTNGLIARLLYGSGMRLMEVIRLRVQDVDFDRNEIVVRAGKGAKDRITMMPNSLKPALKSYLVERRILFESDMDKGQSSVYLPNALHKKYPNAGKEWRWQYIFPSTRLSTDPRTAVVRRHHRDEKNRSACNETGL